jgi:aspartate-semialdehyde dehydrogenase
VAWNCFRGRPQQLESSAPPQPLRVPDGTEPAAAVARCESRQWYGGHDRPAAPMRGARYKFVALGHNTIRGAAGAAILNAELMHREGLL